MALALFLPLRTPPTTARAASETGFQDRPLAALGHAYRPPLWQQVTPVDTATAAQVTPPIGDTVATARPCIEAQRGPGQPTAAIQL